MQILRTLTISSSIAVACAGFGCSNAPANSDTFAQPTPTGGSSGTSSATGGTSSSATGGQGSGITVGTPSGTSGAGSGSNVEKCTGTSQGTTPLPPILEFLIDYSGSMNQRPEGQTLPKYQATADALIQAFTDMADGTGIGLIFYPNTGSRDGGDFDTCINRQEAVRIQTLNATVRQTLISALMAKATAGATPTHDAFNFAVKTVAESTLMGSKYVVLVTDGAPTYSLNCMGDGQTAADNAPLIQAVSDANTASGIKTFVIGSPGSEPAREALSQMATRGGTAPPGCSDTGPNYCHFDMTTAPDLSAALNTAFRAITGSVIACNYTIPPPMNGMVVDPKLVNVKFINGAGHVTTITKDPAPAGGACNQGWQYNADSTQVQLCPDTCELVRADKGAKIEVELGCMTMVR